MNFLTMRMQRSGMRVAGVMYNHDHRLSRWFALPL